MSYRVNTLRPQSGATESNRGEAGEHRPAAATRGQPGGAEESRDDRPAGRRPIGASYSESVEWGKVGAFTAGAIIGALIGAGTALLSAPQSGLETRLAIKRGARRARVRAEDRWDLLGRELRTAARRKKRDLRRGVTRSRWRAADAFE